MHYKQLKWPKVTTVSGRSSTIRGQFIKAIVPHIPATEEEVHACLKVLGQDPEDLKCSYCGITATEWDHFRPVVKGRKPTRSVTDVYNLVPACGKCNQSKSGSHWRVWMTGSARLVPKAGAEQEQRIKRLEEFENWSNERTYWLSETFLNSPLVQDYLDQCEALIRSLSVYDEMALQIRASLERGSH